MLSLLPINLRLQSKIDFFNITAKYLGIILAFVVPISNALTSVISILMVICCVLSLNKQKLHIIKNNPACIAIICFILFYWIAAYFSIGLSSNVLQALRKTSRLLYIPLFIPLFLDNKWKLRIILAFLMAMVLSMLIIFGKVSGILPADLFHTTKTVAFKDSIFTGLFTAFSIFILGYLYQQYPNTRKIIVPFMMLQVYYLLFISSGRTGQWIFVILYLLFCWQQFKNNWRYLITSILLLTIIVTASLLLPSSFANRQNEAWQETVKYFLLKNQIEDKEFIATNANSSMGLRLTFFHNSLQLITTKPLLGWGPGSFIYVYKNFAEEARHGAVNRTNPHNQYILYLVELGIIGLIGFLIVIFYIWRNYLLAESIYGQLGIGLLMAIGIGCLANSWLMDYASMHFFVVLAATFFTPKVV